MIFTAEFNGLLFYLIKITPNRLHYFHFSHVEFGYNAHLHHIASEIHSCRLFSIRLHNAKIPQLVQVDELFP